MEFTTSLTKNPDSQSEILDLSAAPLELDGTLWHSVAVWVSDVQEIFRSSVSEVRFSNPADFARSPLEIKKLDKKSEVCVAILLAPYGHLRITCIPHACIICGQSVRSQFVYLNNN